jgi:glycosyltransferase involved in cell wall biosynthesis
MPAYSRYAAAPEVQRYLASARAVWEQVDGGAGYDAVEVVDWGMLFAPWTSEDGPPVVVQLHGSSGQIAAYDSFPGTELAGETLRLLEAGLLRGARSLQTYSRANAAFWSGMTGRDVGASPPPVPPTERRAAGRRAEGFVAGRIQEWKGPQTLAEALRRLGADAPRVEWAGRAVAHPRTGEPYDDVLRREYPDVWGPRVVQIGRVAPDVVAERQAGAAFVVVPSLWDVYNLTVAEAMQQGAVVLCSDGAGGSDLVDDGRTAFAFPAGDADALAACIRRALALSPAERGRMGEAAREASLRETDPDRVASAAAARYATLGALPAPSPVPWLATAARPGAAVAPDGFLHHLPLRGILAHAAGRARALVRARLTSR